MAAVSHFRKKHLRPRGYKFVSMTAISTFIKCLMAAQENASLLYYTRPIHSSLCSLARALIQSSPFSSPFLLALPILFYFELRKNGAINIGREFHKTKQARANHTIFAIQYQYIHSFRTTVYSCSLV